MDLWSGLVPWTVDSPDRDAAVLALLEGKSSVLSLDGVYTAAQTVDEKKELKTSISHGNDGLVVADDATTRIPEPTTMASATAGREASPPSSFVANTLCERKQPLRQPIERSDLYGYWMFLASHILQRLLVECSSDLLSQHETSDIGHHMNDNNDNTVSHSYRRFLCYFCYGLSCALFGPHHYQQRSGSGMDDGMSNSSEQKWDRAGTGAARHWLARLMTSITAATAGHALSPCSSASQTTTTTTTGKRRAKNSSLSTTTSSLSLPALAAATLCLEHLTAVSGNTVTLLGCTGMSSSDLPGGTDQASHHHYWRSEILPVLVQLATDGMDSDLGQSCRRAFADVAGGDWSAERACLLELQVDQPSRTGLNTVFGEITRKHPPFRVERGRLAFRRWAPVVLDWYSQAPFALLQQALALLRCSSDLVMAVVVDPPPSLPLAMVARWASWIVEWSSRSGARAPTTGTFDHHLKKISLGRKKKTKAHDLRVLGLDAAHCCIEYHAATLAAVSLHENCLGELGMINDQEDWDGTATGGEERGVQTKEEEAIPADTESTIENTAFYPFVAHLLSNLARVAGGSGNISNAVELIESAMAAFVIQRCILRDVNLVCWTLEHARTLMSQLDDGAV